MGDAAELAIEAYLNQQEDFFEKVSRNCKGKSFSECSFGEVEPDGGFHIITCKACGASFDPYG